MRLCHKYTQQLSILALLILVSMVGCSQTPEERLQSLYQEGLQQLSEYRLNQADSSFARITVEFPTSPMGELGKAKTLERRLLYFDAIQSYISVIGVAPQLAEASRAVGHSFARVGDFEESAKAYTNFAILEPDNPMAQFESARAHLANRSPVQAQLAIKKAIAVGLAEPLKSLIAARLHVMENKLEVAREEYAKGLTELGEEAEGYREIADYFEQLGWYDSAMYHSAKSAQLANFDIELDHFYRSLRLNYFYSARQLIEKVRQRENSENVVRALEISYYRATNQGFLAHLASTQFRQLYPSSISSMMQEINVRWMIKDSYAVRQDRSGVLELMTSKGYSEAFQAFVIGRMSLEFSGFTEMLEDLEDLRKSTGWKLQQREHMLQELFLLSVTGQSDSVDSRVKDILVSHGSHAEWLVGMADVYSNWRARVHDKADKLYRRALAVAPLNKLAFDHLMAMEMDMDQWETALKIAEEHAQLVALVPGAALQKAHCLLELGRWDEAMSLAEQALPQVRGDVGRFEQVLKVLKRMRQTERADRLVDLLADLGSNNPDALTMAASYHLDHKDGASARTLVEAGLKLEADNIGLNVQMARVLIENEEYEKGIELFEKLKIQNDGNPMLNIHYSRALAQDGHLFRRAENVARRAVFFDQSSVEARLNLCYVYSQMDRFDLVKGEARGAVQLDDKSADAYFWLGLASYKLGSEGAKENLTKAIEFGLSGEQLVEAEASLQLLN